MPTRVLKNTRMFLPVLAGIVLAIAGCSATFEHSVDFNPREPLRVAVLPFYQTDSGKIVPAKVDSSILVDNLPLVSSRLGASPASFVQGVVQQDLKKTSLDLVSPGYVQAQLGHHGFVAGGEIEIEKILGTTPQDLGELLGADALLFGNLTEWSRAYYGIQSQSTVGIDMRLIRAKDGKVLFTAHANDSEGRGLTGIPTGFSSAFLEPIAGLDSEVIQQLSERTVNTMLEPLTTTNKPAYLNSSPPAIFAAAHNGSFKSVSGRAPLRVLLLGTPGKQALFSFGKTQQRIPMLETEAGHYVGTFVPEPGVSVEPEVTVALQDEFGRVSSRAVEGKVSFAQ